MMLGRIISNRKRVRSNAALLALILPAIPLVANDTTSAIKNKPITKPVLAEFNLERLGFSNPGAGWIYAIAGAIGFGLLAGSSLRMKNQK